MATSKRSAKKAPARRTPARPKPAGVTFTCHAPEAHHVALAGSFNDWDPQAHPMSRGAEGTWTASLSLAPGTYQYKYVIDGDWREDPANPNRAWDSNGICNSVIEVA